MWQSDGEPAWQDKTYTARKDKKTLDRNKQGRTQRCARHYQLRASKANTNGQTIPD
jgi:hypothetical protein